MKAEKKMASGEIPAHVMEYILKSLAGICYGQVVLVAQDGYLIQVERSEKLRLVDWKMCHERAILSTVVQECLSQRIRQSFSRLSYGKLVIVVTGGNIVQIELTEKHHFTELNGESI